MSETVQGRGEGAATSRVALRLPWLGLLGLLFLLPPSLAEAGRVAVLDFGGGAAGRRARAGLVRDLVGREGLELVSSSTFADAAAQAGVAPSELTTGSGIRRAAAVAMVDVVVSGKVSGKGARSRIWIEVWDADGQQRLNKAYRPSGGALELDDLERIAAFLLTLAPPSAPVDPPPPLDPPEDPYRPDPEPRRDPPPDPYDRPDPEPRRDPPPDPYDRPDPEPRRDPPPDPYGRPDPRDRDSGVGARIDDPGRGADRGRRPEGDDWARDDDRRGQGGTYDPLHELDDDRPPFVVFHLLGQAATRDYLLQGSFTTVEYHTQGVFPEVGGALELAPGAGAGPWLEDLALEARGSYGFLASQFEDTTGTLQRRGTPVIRFAGDLHYRVPLAPSSGYSPRLGVRGGWYLSRFQVALGNPLFRTVTHSGLRLGVDVKQPLLPPFLALRVWATLLPFSSPGAAEAEAYGPQATSRGYWASMGFVGSTEAQGRGLTWMVALELISHRDRFAGTGTEDANASASEEQLVVSGGLGFAF
ncbi:MAG: hypothetical protein P1V51_21980 [Deltaproteobacteria bacterium]|nr:hypothetical protein [Deltaproteobacteria bacterium]